MKPGLLTLALPALCAASQPTIQPLAPVHYDLDVSMDLRKGELSARTGLTFRNTGTQPLAEASLTLYRLLEVQGVTAEDGQSLAFRQQVTAYPDFWRMQVNHITVRLPKPLAPGQSTRITVAYAGPLAGYTETGMRYLKDRIDESFAMIRTDLLAYPVLGHPTLEDRKQVIQHSFTYRASMEVPATHAVANGGHLVKRETSGDRTRFTFECLHPSWRMDFAVARFGEMEGDNLKVVHLLKDAEGAARVLKGAQGAKALFKKAFGPPSMGLPFSIIQLPEGWGSQNDVTAILQEGGPFLKDASLQGIYHEISHFWNVRSPETDHCRWEEGLATFLQSWAETQLDGTPSLERDAERLFRRLKQDAQANESLRKIPPMDFGRHGLTDASYSALGLAFHLLHRTLGEAEFLKVYGSFFKQHVAKGGTTVDLLRHVRQQGGPRVEPILKDWFESTAWTERLASTASLQALREVYTPR